MKISKSSQNTASGQRFERPAVEVLSDEVVGQIAAGEVIERPASVVKELVENAIDAQSRRVVIDVWRGGMKRIRIHDDGMGMSQRDAVRALQRHATSKLRSVADLDKMQTLGFRGEGLPSVCAVSKLTLRTREAESDTGLECVIESGRLMSQNPVGMAPGTQIDAHDLFFNVPVRAKFMKNPATETAYISDIVVRLASSTPRVHFTLRHEGRVLADFPTCSDRESRAQDVLRRHRVQSVRSVSAATPQTSILAILAMDRFSSNPARSLTFVVNGRPVRDLGLARAIAGAYGDRLPISRFPWGVVYIDLPETDVDINYHPQKIKVRFADAAALGRALNEAISRALKNSCSAVEPRAEGWSDRSSARETDPRFDTYYESPMVKNSRASEATERFWPGHAAEEKGPSDRAAETDFGLGAALNRIDQRSENDAAPQKTCAMESESTRSAIESSKAALRHAPLIPSSGLEVVGRVFEYMLLCIRGEVIYLFDERRAWHDILRFRFVRQELGDSKRPFAQREFPHPVIVDLTREEGAAMTQMMATFWLLGLEVESFGASSLLLRGLPSVGFPEGEIADTDVAAACRSLLRYLVRTVSDYLKRDRRVREGRQAQRGDDEDNPDDIDIRNRIREVLVDTLAPFWMAAYGHDRLVEELDHLLSLKTGFEKLSAKSEYIDAGQMFSELFLPVEVLRASSRKKGSDPPLALTISVTDLAKTFS